MSAAPLLELTGVSAGYRDVPIIKDLSIRVMPGEVVCVIGPNGAGKSTLIKSVMGLLKIFSGSIVLDAKEITRLPAEKHIDAGIGYVPQVANVFGALTVRENLFLSCKGRNVAEAMDRMLAMFPELKVKLALPAGSLSGGERQMLAFARCLIVEPRLLLLDEPTAALSPLLVGEVFDRIAGIAADNTAVLLVEQNALRALTISHRVYALAGGTNAIEGTAAEMLANPDLKQIYLGGKGNA
ncbi:ABC transporter ATP-binding protein [Ciceribacter selenitireducens]